MSWQIARWYVVAIVLLIADQLAKYTITQNFLYGEYINIFPGLDFTLVHNTGAAFSFLSDAGGWQRYGFSILAAGVSAVIAVWLARQPAERWFECLALALILGGALGN